MTVRAFGYDVVQYDGHNHESIVKALGFERGDGVVVIPNSRPLVIRSSVLDEIRSQQDERLNRARDRREAREEAGL